MIARYVAPCFFFFLAFVGYPQTKQSQNLTVMVPVADMYSGPTEDSDVVSQVLFGSNVLLLEEKSNWVKIRSADQYSGWIAADKIRDMPMPYASSGRVVQVTGLSANLYREPDVTTHRPLLTIPFETHLEVATEGPEDDADWLKVRLPDQRLAWIQRGDVDLAPHALTIQQSIGLARRFLGVTYTWGGTSSQGFDCSGFTQMLVRSRGITMPRDAGKQAAWEGAIPIDRRHLQPGDLLFFGAPDRITHTGMFIGHGKFIHDTTNGHPGVQISVLNDLPWTKLLLSSRRVK